MRMIFWDFHGTLTPPDHNWSPAVHEAAQEVRPDLTWEEVSRAMADEGFPWHTWKQEGARLQQPGAWWDYVEQAVFAETLRRLGLPEADCRRLAPTIRARVLQPGRFRLYPGVPAMLEALRERGYHHAVLSNNFPELEQLLTAMGIRGAFDQVFVSAVMGYDKPHPELFRQAMAACGPMEQAIMVGDNPKGDIAGGHGAGMHTIWIARGRTYTGTVQPDHIVQLPTDVPDVVGGQPC